MSKTYIHAKINFEFRFGTNYIYFYIILNDKTTVLTLRIDNDSVSLGLHCSHLEYRPNIFHHKRATKCYNTIVVFLFLQPMQ